MKPEIKTTTNTGSIGLYSPDSKRQKRKAMRAQSSRPDKWGQSKQLSRKQRRAIRRSVWARTYGNGAGGGCYTLQPGAAQGRAALGSGSQDTSLYVYGGGSFNCQ